jgi:hypothetical protein
MSRTIFFATAGMGRKAQAHALVAKDGFSARYHLDRVRGVFSRPEHKLADASYVGRLLVLDAAKGGVAMAWMLHEMKTRGVMPAAAITTKSERTDRWTKMRRSRARSSRSGASSRVRCSVGCITSTSESEFLVQTGSERSR